eukprot:c19254_g1_i1 orf=181-756(+)
MEASSNGIYQVSMYGYKAVRKNTVTGTTLPLHFEVWRARKWRHRNHNINRSGILLSVRASFTPDNGLGSKTLEGSDSGSFGTRLSQVLLTKQAELVGKINDGRKKLPMKIFLVLLGFYAANALATILGQTGDWDVLVAGIVVAIIELIGSFMYQEKYKSMAGRFRGYLVMLNYWKAGFTLGLFVDAFKVGS